MQVLPIPVQVGKSVQVLPVPVHVGKVCRFCLYLFRWGKCADMPVPYAGIGLNGSKCKQDVWNRNLEAVIVSIATPPITYDSQFLRLLLAIML